MNETRKTLIFFIVVLLIAAAALFYFLNNQKDIGNPAKNPGDNNPATTTANSYPTGWEAKDTSTYSFAYPPSVGGKYAEVLDWPPAVAVTDVPYSCTTAGEATARAGRTESISINGHAYCRTTESEGAAGSVYVQYAYAFPRDNKTVILTWSTRLVQCANYDTEEQNACVEAQNQFDADALIDGVAETLTLK